MDVACKAKYSRNKLVLLALNIQHYESEHGGPPQRLDDIAAQVEAFFHQNEELCKEYLDARWASEEISTCQLAPGYFIAYVVSSDGHHYYLAALWSESLMHKVTYSYLETSSMAGFPERGISYVIKDGCPHFSRYKQFPANQCINESNYREFLTPYTFTGHIWVD
jgi:hypothetical protein